LKHTAVVLILFLLSGCTQLLPHQTQSSDPCDMLLDGIQTLMKDGSTVELEALIKKYPESRQAAAAMQLLNEPQPTTIGKTDVEKLRNQNNRLSEDLGKLRHENELLKNDLEKLRQLLIKSEKRSS
jgi:hypothetical protein